MLTKEELTSLPLDEQIATTYVRLVEEIVQLKERVRVLEGALVLLTDPIDEWDGNDKHTLACECGGYVDALLIIAERLTGGKGE